ncbi:uncharacterized protein LOC101208094 [Cucumis sativus]|uniref:Uncharacterized protein n=1 Tax=Cucumis sativus TaxID=3659 RepID=A0A0A0L2N6_CUCSA|nr:uncharacterized protein LOC101208094 [Cucumis sativus]KGN55983.1 hypothetical protein Csa_009527 [Cucumis sativus]
MLSIENPPPDPPYQQLKTNKDERPSQNFPLPEEDLSNAATAAAAVLDHSTFSNFSLRDYVFDSRGKDIRNNWPFSLKSLQLCLKHGVKDLLPPLQSPNCVRNQRLVELGGGSSTSEFRDTSVFHEEFSGPKEHVELDTSDAKLDQKQVSTCIESSSCRCEGENGFSSTMTSISQPQKELVSTSGPSSSSLKPDHLLETPVVVQPSGFPASEKNGSKIKTPGKRCKIIRKSTNHGEQTSAADIAMSFSTLSESMASKICPVCKTFSSSSNTTLNAHIDQCLSIASTPKCTSDSKLTRLRIKPRKTKLMVDIYATARTCTLEELDRRNGTAWASLSGLPAQDIENCQINGGKKQKVMPDHPDEDDIGNNAGAVYIDANGTKLRILSKFNSPPSNLPKVQNDLGSKKLGGLKGRKFHSVKKKKYHASKHHKHFKLAAQGSKVPPQKCISQVQEGENQWKGCSSLEAHKITKQAKPHDSGTLRQWACSKRTRASKSSRKEGYQPSTFKWHLSHETVVDTDRSVLADSFIERSQVRDQTNFSEHCVSSPESSERTDNSEYEAHISDKRGWSLVRRNLRSSFSGEMVDSGSPTQTKKTTNHLSKGSGYVDNNYMVNSQNTNGKIIKDYQPSDFPPGFNKISRNYHANGVKTRNLNSSRRKEIHVSGRSSTGSKSPQFNQFSTYEKPDEHFGSHVDEEIIAWHSSFDHSHSSSDESIESDQSAKEEVTEVASPKVSIELKNRSNREAMSKAMALMSSSDSEPEYDGRHKDKNMDSHVRMGAEFQEKIKRLELGSKENSFHEDVSVDSSSKLAPKEGFMCFCKSMDPQFQKTNNNVTRCGMLQSSQNCSCSFYGSDGTKGGLSESSFGHGQEMFFADEDCSAMMGHDAQRELDSEARQGSSCFEVDPISIPGPPGSFLPSPPRDMRSEEYRGNSSLSNSWVHSCQDQHDLIDGDSSGSPISATSTISNSTASRSCFKHNNSSGVSSDIFHEKLGSVSSKAGALPSVENDVGLTHVVCTDDGRINGDKFKVSKLSVERGTPGAVNDGQPCRCQRVDRVSQGINVTYQEPQLTRQQMSTLETMPTIDRKQITYSLNVRPNNLDIMPEGPALSNGRQATPENMGFPVNKSPFKSYPIDGFSDSGPRFSSNCEPASPVTSNPVLRLMGKNLMVVNKDEEDVAMPVKKTQPHPQQQPQHHHVSSQVPSFSSGSMQNVRNQASGSFPHWPHQDSLKDQNAGNVLGQYLDVRLSKGFRNPGNLNMPLSHGREQTTLFLKQQTDGGHTASQAYERDYTNEALNRPERKLSEASMYNTSRALKMPDHQQMNSLSTTNAIKEINAMGDTSYCEARFIANDPKYPGGMRTTLQIIAPAVSIPFSSSGNPLHVNAFCYQPKDALNLDKPAPIHNSSFQSTPSRKDRASPVKWDCNSEPPYVCRRGVF